MVTQGRPASLGVCYHEELVPFYPSRYWEVMLPQCGLITHFTILSVCLRPPVTPLTQV